METTGQRISKIKEFYYGKGRGSTSKFAEKVGENPNTVSNWFGREDGIGPTVIKKIISAFPDVDKGWLVGGNGSMLVSGTLQDEPVKNYKNGVPYYDVDFECGFDIMYNDNTNKPAYLIDFAPYNKATCWCNVTGHSMEPEINNGDMVALKEISDWSFLPFGEIYAIVTTNDMRTIKRLGDSPKENTFTLIPTNTSMGYSPQELRADMILKIFKVLGSVKKF